MNICYWNIGKKGKPEDKQFYQAIKKIIDSHSPDLICLSEYEFFDDTFLVKNGYSLVDNVSCDKAKCFQKNGFGLVQIRVGDRYCFVEDGRRNCLFVFLHAYDSRNYNEDRRLLCMSEIKGEIDEHIHDRECVKVFIVGDFNCMPYSNSIMSKDVLNCTLFRGLLETKSNADERYYNPMLLLLSEEKGVYGSFFSDSLPDNLRWYLLDQVIVNKNADKIIDYDSIRFLTEIGDINILKNGKPNSQLYSDHLPLYFQIKEEEYE